MLINTHFVRHEACPECRKLGNDRHGNNLGVYSDGSNYCFKCGYSTRRSFIPTQVARVEPTVVLPHDVVSEIPAAAKQWLGRYQLSRLDLQPHHLMWSEQWSRLIFPYFDATGLLAWQGRYIGEDTTKAKWFSQGKIHEIIHPVKVTKREAVLVEDIVSAIKVSRFTGAIPIFGSSVSNKQLLRLKTVVDRVWYYLDPDMRAKSVKLSATANLLGLKSSVIFSDRDPKEHTNEELECILKECH